MKTTHENLKSFLH